MIALTHGGFGHGLANLLFFGFFFAMALAVFAFWLWMLVDCLAHEPPGMEKIVWILVILFTHVVGAVLYLVIRRRERLQARRAGVSL